MEGSSYLDKNRMTASSDYSDTRSSHSEDSEQMSIGLDDDNFEWTVEAEVQLLLAMVGHNKIYGLDKHFHMAAIWTKFRNLTNYNVSSKLLWDKLASWYDLKALEERENKKNPPAYMFTYEEFSVPEEWPADCEVEENDEYVSETEEVTNFEDSSSETKGETTDGFEASDSESHPETSACSDDLSNLDKDSKETEKTSRESELSDSLSRETDSPNERVMLRKSKGRKLSLERTSLDFSESEVEGTPILQMKQESLPENKTIRKTEKGPKRKQAKVQKK